MSRQKIGPEPLQQYIDAVHGPEGPNSPEAKRLRELHKDNPPLQAKMNGVDRAIANRQSIWPEAPKTAAGHRRKKKQHKPA